MFQINAVFYTFIKESWKVSRKMLINIDNKNLNK